MIQRSRSLCLLAVAAALAAPASAQQYVYPAKGQTPEKQKSDEAACHSWAVQQTGFDPAKAPPPVAAAPTTATGTTPGAGARGAAKGAVVGGIVGDDAGTGAAVGAAAARSQSRRQNKAAAQQQSCCDAAAAGGLREGARGMPGRQGLHRQMTPTLATKPDHGPRWRDAHRRAGSGAVRECSRRRRRSRRPRRRPRP